MKDYKQDGLWIRYDGSNFIGACLMMPDGPDDYVWEPLDREELERLLVIQYKIYSWKEFVK